mmetsp:Transcript_2222/g.5869  ORF Transcript_2222/g.5869 Transcript_2222/m.5869 type:complete len:299 (+) Transcript_2222:2-898(+)
MNNAFVWTLWFHVCASNVVTLANMKTQVVPEPIGVIWPFRSAYFFSSEISKLEFNVINSRKAVAARLQNVNGAAGTDSRPADLVEYSDAYSRFLYLVQEYYTRLNNTDDFQARQLLLFQDTSWQLEGVDFWQELDSASWNVVASRAMAQGLTAPLRPPRKREGGPELLAILSAPRAPPVLPVLLNRLAQLEYRRLLDETTAVIAAGNCYRTWCRSEKVAFLDKLEAVERSWEPFLTRCHTLGAINPAFVQQCTDFFRHSSIRDFNHYKQILKRLTIVFLSLLPWCRENMRTEAENCGM